MLSIPRRMDNEHGHRIYPIIKPHLYCEHHSNRGYRHMITSHLKHGTKIGNSQTALSVPSPTNPTHNKKTHPLSPLPGRNTRKRARFVHYPEEGHKDRHTTNQQIFGIHHPTARLIVHTLGSTPTHHIEKT